MRARADAAPEDFPPDPGHSAVLGMVQAYLAASRETQSLDEQRRLLRQACTRIRAHLRHAEQMLQDAPGTDTATRKQEHRHIIAGMERLLKTRFKDDADWRGRYLHAMDELVILEISAAAARRAATAH